MKLTYARKGVWNALENAALAEKMGHTAHAIAFSSQATMRLLTIVDKSKQGPEVTIASMILGMLQNGRAEAAFDYVSKEEVHYDTGSPTRLGWKDL
jgi:hypothetical protein